MLMEGGETLVASVAVFSVLLMLVMLVLVLGACTFCRFFRRRRQYVVPHDEGAERNPRNHPDPEAPFNNEGDDDGAAPSAPIYSLGACERARQQGDAGDRRQKGICVYDRRSWKYYSKNIPRRPFRDDSSSDQALGEASAPAGWVSRDQWSHEAGTGSDREQCETRSRSLSEADLPNRERLSFEEGRLCTADRGSLGDLSRVTSPSRVSPALEDQAVGGSQESSRKARTQYVQENETGTKQRMDREQSECDVHLQTLAQTTALRGVSSTAITSPRLEGRETVHTSRCSPRPGFKCWRPRGRFSCCHYRQDSGIEVWDQSKPEDDFSQCQKSTLNCICVLSGSPTDSRNVTKDQASESHAGVPSRTDPVELSLACQPVTCKENSQADPELHSKEDDQTDPSTQPSEGPPAYPTTDLAVRPKAEHPEHVQQMPQNKSQTHHANEGEGHHQTFGSPVPKGHSASQEVLGDVNSSPDDKSNTYQTASEGRGSEQRTPPETGHTNGLSDDANREATHYTLSQQAETTSGRRAGSRKTLSPINVSRCLSNETSTTQEQRTPPETGHIKLHTRTDGPSGNADKKAMHGALSQQAETASDRGAGSRKTLTPTNVSKCLSNETSTTQDGRVSTSESKAPEPREDKPVTPQTPDQSHPSSRARSPPYLAERFHSGRSGTWTEKEMEVVEGYTISPTHTPPLSLNSRRFQYS